MTTVKTANLHRIAHGSGLRGGHSLIPEIHEIGWGKFAVADPQHLKPHQHDDAFEVCLIMKGEVEWETFDQSYVLRSGDLFITRPGELHWGRDGAMQPCSLYWLHISADPDLPPWSSFGERLGQSLLERLARLPRQLKSEVGRLSFLFGNIFSEHQGISGEPWDRRLREVNARAALHQLIIELVRLGGLADPVHRSRAATPPGLKRAIAVIRTARQDAFSSRRIAAKVGMTAAQLNELFVVHTGMSLTQFALRERVRAARSKLRETDRSVTDIAYELGFSSSQHFATMFKRVTGVSPSTYRSAEGGAS